ncbi:hypothetical protein B0H14DRAFT_3166401 [Mycena olivaceomarginata]|nr:hypothetical protein B0H14DRAFT_3166401 [Mycena olivaceomarginata]
MCCPASSAPPPSSLPSEFYIAGVWSSIFSCAMRYIQGQTMHQASLQLRPGSPKFCKTSNAPPCPCPGSRNSATPEASRLNPTQSSTIKHIRTAETFMSRRLRRTHVNLSIACEPQSRRFEVHYRLSQDLKLDICSAIQLHRHFPRLSLPPPVNSSFEYQSGPACRTHCVATWYRPTSSMIAGSPRKTEKGELFIGFSVTNFCTSSSDSGHGSCIQPQRSTSNSRRDGCQILGLHLALLRMDRLLSDTSASTPAFWLSLCSDVCESSILSFLLTQAQPMPSFSHSHPDNIQPSTRTVVVH